MADSIASIPLRLLAVIVLYKTSPRESVSYCTLNAALKHSGIGKISLKIFFYDNTPANGSVEYPEESIYEAPGENRGIADAYNRAIEIAYSESFDWILTLDQDTKLPIDFLDKIADTVAFVTNLKQVAAIVPLIYDNVNLISPNAGSYTMFPKKFSNEFVGISLEKWTSAFNSASTLRVSALMSIGGYDKRFWLDYSDAVMYHRLESNGMRVFVAGNIRVEHELSVMDMKHRVTPERYEAILGAESAYCDECMGIGASFQLLLKSIYRSFYKFLILRRDLEYCKIAIRFLSRRIFLTRSRRIEKWESSVRSRLKKINV